jgi:hypothetical protein
MTAFGAPVFLEQCLSMKWFILKTNWLDNIGIKWPNSKNEHFDHANDKSHYFIFPITKAIRPPQNASMIIVIAVSMIIFP